MIQVSLIKAWFISYTSTEQVRRAELGAHIPAQVDGLCFSCLLSTSWKHVTTEDFEGSGLTVWLSDHWGQNPLHQLFHLWILFQAGVSIGGIQEDDFISKNLFTDGAIVRGTCSLKPTWTKFIFKRGSSPERRNLMLESLHIYFSNRWNFIKKTLNVNVMSVWHNNILQT